jgi:hypothetical protein
VSLQGRLAHFGAPGARRGVRGARPARPPRLVSVVQAPRWGVSRARGAVWGSQIGTIWTSNSAVLPGLEPLAMWLAVISLLFPITRNYFTRYFARPAQRWGPRQGQVGAVDPDSYRLPLHLSPSGGLHIEVALASANTKIVAGCRYTMYQLLRGVSTNKSCE